MSVKLGEALVYLFGENKGLEDDLNDSEKKTTSWAKNLSGKVGGFLGGALKVGVAGAAAAVVGIGAAAFAAGMQMDEAMDTIAISTGATGEALAGLGDDFRAVFTSIPTDAESASGALGELNKRLGLTGPALQDVSKNVLEASRLMGTDATKSAEGLSQAMLAWGADASTAAGTMDMFFVASQKSGVGMDQLMSQVQSSAPMLKGLGFTMEESIALFANFSKAGVDSGTAMTGLRTAAAAFSKEGVPLQQGLADVTSRIQGAKTDSEALSIAFEVFGARAGPAMVTAIRSGAMSLDDMNAALGESQGAIAATADATADFPEKFAVFKNVASTALAPLGIALMDVATTLLEMLGPAILQVAAWAGPAFEALGTAVSMVFDVLRGTGGDIPWEDILPGWAADAAYAISGAFAGIAGTVGGFISSLSGAQGQMTGISSALAGMGAPVSGLGAAFQTVAGIVSSVASQIGPILYNIFVTQMQTALAVATTVWGTIANVISTVVPVIITLIGMIAERAVPVLVQAFQIVQQVVSDVAGFVVPLVQQIAQLIQEQFGIIVAWVQANMPLIQATMDTVFGAIKVGLGVLLQVWNTVWPVMKEVVIIVFNIIKTAVETAVQVILNIIKLGMQLITGDWEGAWETFKTIITTALTGVLTIVEGLLADVGAAIGGKVGEWLNLGADLVAGLVKGIQDNAGKVLDTMLGMVKNGVDAVKNFFGIKSPSKVMIAIGENLTGGLAIGIEAGGVEATAAMQKVVSSIAKAFKDLASAFHQMNKVQKVEGGLPDLELWARAMKEAIVRFATAVSEATKEVSDRVIRKAQEFAGKIKELFELLRTLGSVLSDLNAIKAIPDLGPFGAALKQAIVVAASAILEAAAQLGDKALKSAGKLSDEAQQIVALIGPAVGALGAVAEMKEVTDLDAKTATLSDAINTFLNKLNYLASRWVNTALDDATKFADAALKVIGLIGPAVQALGAFVEFPAVTDLDAKTATLSDAINTFLNKLNFLALRWVGTGLDDATKFAEAAQKIIALIGPAVQALGAFVEFPAVQDLEAKTGELANSINTFLNKLNFLALRWVGTGLADAVAFSEAAQKIIGVIKPAVDALAAMATYKPVLGLTEMMQNFSLDLYDLVDEMVYLAGRFAAEGVAAAGAFGTAVGQLVGMIKPAIDALVALAEYKAVRGLLSAIQNFSLDLYDLVDEMVYLASAFAVEGVTAAAAFAGSVGQIVGMIKPGLDAIAALVGYKPSKGFLAAIQNFSLDLFDLIDELVFLASRFTTEGLTAAAGFATAVGQIVALVKPGLDTIKTLATYKSVKDLPKHIGEFGLDLYRVVDELVRVALAFGVEAIAAAVTFQSSVGQIVGMVKPALDTIKTLGDYKTKGTLAEKLDLFAQDLYRVVSAIVGVSRAFGEEAVLAAIVFGERVSEMLESIKPAVDGISDMAGYTQKKGLTKALEGFQTDMLKVVRAITDVAAALGSEAVTAGPVGAFQGLALAAENGMDRTLAALKKGIEGMLSAMRGVPGEIWDIFASFDWGGIGKGVADGIATGIRRGAAAIKAAAREAALAALEAAKQELGIASPSAVMREQVGRQAGLGVALGVRDMIPEIRNAMADLSGQMGGGGTGVSPYAPTSGVDLGETNGLLGQMLANLRALVSGVQGLQPAAVMDARALARQLEFEARMGR